ncbi:MAG: hypothetical protein B5M52_05810 [Helicobacteraceae bacterium 4484_230]|nr:MAG: hypothetical protein B5M52_05810 [Helicobacteraceae bacterium 4484_230]
MNDNYPVIVKSYELTLWYLKKLEKLPKNHRFTIGERIQESLLDLVLILSDAIYSSRKKDLLLQANKSIEKIRLLTRLLKDLTLLSNENFRFVTNSLNEIGAMVGGWIKHVK